MASIQNGKNVSEKKEVPLFKLGELDAEAMRFLYELGTKNRSYTVQEIDGRMYVNTNDLVRIKEPFPAVLPTVNIFTLSGLVDYILNDPDGQLDKFGNLVVQVTDPRKVVLYGIKCSDDYAVRAELARVVTDNEPFEFGRYIGQEEFIVQLQSRFIETDNSLEVGKVVGNLSVEKGTNTSDDGISQRVTVRDGVVRVSDVVIKNPVYLRPFRTFCEIDQPESPFILRIRNSDGKGTPEIALYEADGGLWKHRAIQGIHAYLDKALDNLVTSGMVTIIA